MRLIITGKTRSGKTTGLHGIAAHALPMSCWENILILDGKGDLSIYDGLPNVTYHGPEALEAWRDELETRADAMPARYRQLQARGLTSAPDDDKRLLIIADEVQRGCRAKKFGSGIKQALALIAEQSAALGDVLITASQRAVGAVPPTVRENASAELQMLGAGFFYLKADGHPTRSGVAAWLTPAEASERASSQPAADAMPLTCCNLSDILGSIIVETQKAPGTLYLGTPGAGKTHALHNHKAKDLRRVYVDLGQPHRAALVGVVEKAGAVVPPRTAIPDLAEIARLSIQSQPTILLLDNAHQASEKTLASVERLIEGAAAIAAAADKPRSPAERRRLDRLVPRCECIEIEPLSREQAKALLWDNLDREQMKKPKAVESKVINESGGNPKTIVKLAQRIQKGDAAELRTMQTPVKQINIGWLFIAAAVAIALVSRRVLDSYAALFVVTMAAIVLRPMIYKAMRSNEQ